MKKTITLSKSSSDKDLYKEAQKAARSRTLISYDGLMVPVIFAGPIGGKPTLVLLVSEKERKSAKKSKNAPDRF